jgi:ribosomal protein S18 acetylase RimI-like enzyme
MQIQIRHTSYTDLDTIFTLYDEAIAYQKLVGNNHWFGFSAEFIKSEIDDQRHYKILGDGVILGTFCVTFADPAIWDDSNEVAAIYIHRIATGKASRGLNLVKHIINWAREYALNNNLLCIRIDTGSGNDRLINYYISCGFTFIGDTKIAYEPGMPLHYKDGAFALLEMHV